LENEIRKRTERLSYLRNYAVRLLQEDERFNAFEFAIIIDLDNVNEVFPQMQILQQVNNWPEGQAAVFANQTDLYYDAWAYRHPKYSPDDCWKTVRNRPMGTSKRTACNTIIAPRRVPWPEDTGMMEVDSAFGGLGIYKISTIKNCEYLGVDDDGFQICEHVEFHRQIRESGHKLFIDASMINGSGIVKHKPRKGKQILARMSHTIGSFMRRQ